MSDFAQTDIGAIRRVVLKHVRDAFVDDRRIDDQWKRLNYTARPDLALAIDEYDRFVELLESCGAQVDFLPPVEDVTLDSIYTRDTSIVCRHGVILCNMGKADRANEPGVIEASLHSLGLTVHGRITGDGRLEGGDVVWLDKRTLAVG